MSFACVAFALLTSQIAASSLLSNHAASIEANGDVDPFEAEIETTQNKTSTPGSVPFLCILTAYKWGSLQGLLKSLDVPVDYILVQQNKIASQATNAVFVPKIVNKYKAKFPTLTLVDHGYNAGFAYSANQCYDHIMEKKVPWGLIMEDDGLFRAGQLQNLVNHMTNNPKQLMVLLDHRRAGAGFAVRPELVKEVGYWDENFYPAYVEDCDYFWRVRNAGIVWSGYIRNNFDPLWDAVPSIPPGMEKRVLFSESSEMAQTRERNECYFRKKWNLSPECGCDQFQSCSSSMYKMPFNNPERTNASWDLIRSIS